MNHILKQRALQIRGGVSRAKPSWSGAESEGGFACETSLRLIRLLQADT